MNEISIVRENLMTVPNYIPYCGDMDKPSYAVGGCDNPRADFNGKQFVCSKCKRTSEFPTDFIDRYKSKWNLD